MADVVDLVSVHCPKCGHEFTHKIKVAGRNVGIVSGAVAGAKVGAGIGLVGGPLGAMAGTIPGALLGALYGGKLGNWLGGGNSRCPKCRTSFKAPR
jgi:uncharacterized membrane protein